MTGWVYAAERLTVKVMGVEPALPSLAEASLIARVGNVGGGGVVVPEPTGRPLKT